MARIDENEFHFAVHFQKEIMTMMIKTFPSVEVVLTGIDDVVDEDEDGQ